MEKHFSIGQAVKFGWEGMKRHFWLFASLIVLAFVLSSVVSLLIPCQADAVVSEGTDQAYVIKACFWPWLLHMLVNILFLIGFTNVALKVARGEKPLFADFWNRFGVYFKMLGANVLYTLLVLVGLVLFIVPGIYFAIKFGFYPYMVVDKGAGPIDALKLSSKATEGVKWDLLGWFIVAILISLAGVLVFLVGLLAALPIVWIAQAYIYRKLIGEQS